jgi:hypothetical protein
VYFIFILLAVDSLIIVGYTITVSEQGWMGRSRVGGRAVVVNRDGWVGVE